VREYLLVFLVALSVTYLLTVIAREIALRTGAVAAVRDRDVHAEPIPYLGGLAMLGGLSAAYLVARELPFLGLRTEGFVFKDAGVVLLAGALVCAVGVIDDIFDLDALTKLGGQVLAAGLLVVMGVRFYYFPSADGTQFALDDAQGALLTLVVVIGTMNAVNFVDGLDGLAAGIVGIGASAFFLYCYMLSDQNNLTLATTGALLSAALAGACAGFLPHNFHPARLFMGDSGSMLIGLVLSASALTLTGQFSGMPNTEGNNLFVTVLPVLLPISLLMVPMVDLVLAVVRRTRAGRSPMSADKQHLHHRLLEIGHSQRRAVLIMWLWAFTLATGAVIVSLFDDPWVWWSLGSMLALTVTMTFVLPKLHRPPKTGLGDTGLPENALAEGRLEEAGEPGEESVDPPVDQPVDGPGEGVPGR
jgi:UDP-GlcNAc:undecaprenyl-phosphate/decaprenyl-phosphate GlcNAc-1-phosphate transferase